MGLAPVPVAGMGEACYHRGWSPLSAAGGEDRPGWLIVNLDVRMAAHLPDLT